MGHGAKPCKITSPRKATDRLRPHRDSGSRQQATNVPLGLDIYRSDTGLGTVRTPTNVKGIIPLRG